MIKIHLAILRTFEESNPFYFLFKKIFNFIFNWRILLYNMWWFLPYINFNEPQVYICPLPLKPPSQLPPQPNPLGCHRAPALGSLCHTANSYWLSNLYVVIYLFHCYSFIQSHLLSPWLCPKICSLCLHLYSCPVDRLIGTIFLDSIYMH